MTTALFVVLTLAGVAAIVAAAVIVSLPLGLFVAGCAALKLAKELVKADAA